MEFCFDVTSTASSMLDMSPSMNNIDSSSVTAYEPSSTTAKNTGGFTVRGFHFPSAMLVRLIVKP
jgi:hypothetical protein